MTLMNYLEWTHLKKSTRQHFKANNIDYRKHLPGRARTTDNQLLFISNVSYVP